MGLLMAFWSLLVGSGRCSSGSEGLGSWLFSEWFSVEEELLGVDVAMVAVFMGLSQENVIEKD